MRFIGQRSSIINPLTKSDVFYRPNKFNNKPLTKSDVFYRSNKLNNKPINKEQ